MSNIERDRTNTRTYFACGWEEREKTKSAREGDRPVREFQEHNLPSFRVLLSFALDGLFIRDSE